MNTLQIILVAVDFSSGSSAALKEAIRLSHTHQAKLHVIHVVDSTEVDQLAEHEGLSPEEEAMIIVQSAGINLAIWLDQLEAPEHCETAVLVGTPTHEILRHAGHIGADLLIAGSCGIGESKSGAGRVAKSLAHQHASPRLLLVHADAAPKQKVRTVRKIIACIDFSDASREVAQIARHLAISDGAHVDFLHVWNEPWHGVAYDTPVAVGSDKLRDGYIEDLRGSLREFVDAASEGIDYSEVLYNASNHGLGIADYAEQSGSDLILMGNKGRTNLDYVPLGSTTERMLGHPPCSVLVIKLLQTKGERG